MEREPVRLGRHGTSAVQSGVVLDPGRTAIAYRESRVGFCKLLVTARRLFAIPSAVAASAAEGSAETSRAVFARALLTASGERVGKLPSTGRETLKQHSTYPDFGLPAAC